jgi:hypothetical protein
MNHDEETAMCRALKTVVSPLGSSLALVRGNNSFYFCSILVRDYF